MIGQNLKDPGITLVPSGGLEPFRAAPGAPFYKESMIMRHLRDQIEAANKDRNPESPKATSISFTFFEFFGVIWSLTFQQAPHQNEQRIAGTIGECIEACGKIYGSEFKEAAIQSIKKLEDEIKAEKNRIKIRERIPTDPIQFHNDYSQPQYLRSKGLTPENIQEEMRQNHSAMIEIAAQFDGLDRKLIEVAAGISMVGHFNHFRGGSGSPHYSIHPLRVAEKILEEFDSLPENNNKIIKNSKKFSPKAIAVAIGLMHDCLEDFHANFSNQFLSGDNTRADYKAVIYDYIFEELAKNFGKAAAEEFLNQIKILSHTDDSEFPTRSFLNASKRNPTTYIVRLSDIDHNLLTSPNYCPTWASIIGAAQYLPFAEGTSFSTTYEENILRCIANIKADAILPQFQAASEGTIEAILIELKEREGDEAISSLESYYTNLRSRIEQGDLNQKLYELSLDEAGMLQSIAMILDSIKATREKSEVQSIGQEVKSGDLSIQSEIIDGTPIRLIGPVTGWSAKIVLEDLGNNDYPALSTVLMGAVKDSSIELKQRVTGYITTEGNRTVYHMCRLPRRADQPVPSIDDYRKICAKIKEKLEKAPKVRVSIIEQERQSTPKFRAVFGLTDRYFEGHRVDILSQLKKGTICDVETARGLIFDLLEDPKAHGFSAEDMKSINNIEGKLSRPLTIRRKFSEAKEYFTGDFKLTEIQIFEAAPDNSQGYSVYREAGFVVESGDRDSLKRFIGWANETHQQQFPLEHLNAGVTFNIELMQFKPVPMTIEALKEKLFDAQIPLIKWGLGGAKSVDQLLKEIHEGEANLVIGADGKLIREIIVGCADVYFNSDAGSRYYLEEVSQVFKDGRSRTRNLLHSMAEKMRSDEDPVEVMIRGVKEELGIAGDLNLEIGQTREELRASPSYPGLLTRYTMHSFIITLTNQQYNPEGYVETKPEMTTYFKWKQVS